MNDSLYYEQSVSGSTDPVTSLFTVIFALAIVIFFFVVTWKVYVKAGRRGWESLVPIYNIYVLMKIAGRPGWWTILYLIPIVNIVIAIITAIDIAKAFGKSAVFGIFGLFLFNLIGYAILAFGDVSYRNPTTVAGDNYSPPTPPTPSYQGPILP